ncbi:MAG: DUF4339 domain-containing protein [Candidatus Hydrogenedentes bacterium]|nr:DUF4339 domain-containing protein [Candidatus Hydrogenedentota bacterium]
MAGNESNSDLDRIFVVKNGQRVGPYTSAQVRAMLDSGMLSYTDYGWHQGLADWIPLSLIFARGQPPEFRAKPIAPNTPVYTNPQLTTQKVDEVLFACENICVTDTQITKGFESWNVSSVVKVSFYKVGPTCLESVVYVAPLLLGVLGILGGSAGSIALSLVFFSCAGGAYYFMMHIYNKGYVIEITIISGEIIKCTIMDQINATRLCECIREAMRRN